MPSIGGGHAGAIRKSASLAALLSLCAWGAAAEPQPASTDFAARAERIYREAAATFDRSPTNVTAAWQFGRASFDWAEFAPDAARRAGIAERGIAACRMAVSMDTNLAAAPYYLGMNLGQLARTKTLGALKLVDEMETLFERARRLDERFDHAGPDRNLGLLYLEAPGWPVSLGSRSKARRHLARSVALAPDHPENRLNLLEARLRWRDDDLQPDVEALAVLLPRARATLAGEEWLAAWTDWDRRWRDIQRRVTATAPKPK